MRVSGLGEMRTSVERVIDEAGPDAIETLRVRLGRAGSEWSYFPGDPLARRVHHVLAERVLREAPVLRGGERLSAVAGAPVVIVANHLSYSDANAIEVILQLSGRQELSDRLTVVAGPKVYSDIRRRFSSLCFGTIKTPQSSGRSTDDAVMTPREVALAAHRSIQAAAARLARGEALLVFPEGTRSRSGRMQPFLPGVARYLRESGAWVLPVGIWGTEALYPMDEGALNSGPVTMSVGRPVPATTLIARGGGDRRLVMDCVGFAVGALLPPEYRGVYDDGAGQSEAARRLSVDLFQ